jgi:glycosyltransferase involved in cell wall biosynthesis
MRVALWHGWRLEGSGSNVFTSRVAEALRAQGHDVLVVCQEPATDAFGFVDGWGTVSADGVSPIEPTRASRAPGRAVVLRPRMGRLLPVFVLDEYPGSRVKRFVDLTDDELSGYLQGNADALRLAVEWHGSDAVIAGHAVPGPSVARMALGPGHYVATIHGSDLEYAVRQQRRYLDLAGEGLEGALAVAGPSENLLQRTVELFPAVADRLVRIPPGVDHKRFRPMPRREGLLSAADRLDAEDRTARGRRSTVDRQVARALNERDGAELDRLGLSYDQDAPDPGAAAALRSLAEGEDPLVGYFGKLIPQKGVDVFLQALGAPSPVGAHALVIGFGSFREWLTALTVALDRGDPDAAGWVGKISPMQLELTAEAVRAAAGLGSRVTFTGRFDHGVAPQALASLTVLAVPSTLIEAFGMVAAEGAAAGALPLVARHSGLAEVAGAIEAAVDRPGWFSYEPGPGAVGRLAAGIERLLAIPRAQRQELRRAVSDFARVEWTWDRTARLLCETGSRPRQT